MDGRIGMGDLILSERYMYSEYWDFKTASKEMAGPGWRRGARLVFSVSFL